MECYQYQVEYYLYHCEDYFKADIPEKWKMTKDLRLCFGCPRCGLTLHTKLCARRTIWWRFSKRSESRTQRSYD